MKQLAFLLLLFGIIHLQAQVFIEIDQKLVGLSQSRALWVHKAGSSDLVVTGEVPGAIDLVQTHYYQAKPKNIFVKNQSGLPDVYRGSMVSVDFNQDGREDVMVTGMRANGKHLSGLYQQHENGKFIKSSVTIPALADGSIEMADFERDGDMDVLMTGRDENGNLKTLVLINDKGYFKEIETKLPGIQNGVGRWADANNDGFLDILLTGQSVTGSISKIYIYQQGTYRSLPQTITPLKYSDAAWADFNNDGMPDFIISGQTIEGNPYTRVYRALKGLIFEELPAMGMRQLMNASVDVSDYNLDGFVDFVITGESLERPYTIVYENQQGLGFRDLIAGLPGVSQGEAVFGDYDGDGDYDLVVTGVDVCYNLLTIVYRNTTDPKRETDEPAEIFLESPMDFTRGPYYYFVFSSCYCDIFGTGQKSYNAFVSNIHEEKSDFNLTYKFNDLLIKNYPGWNWSDRGHRTSNAFVSLKDAQEGRQQIIDSYSADQFKIYYINW